MTTAWRRHDDEDKTVRRRSDDRHKPGFGVQPQLMTWGWTPNPGLWRSSLRRRTVLSSSSCRRHVVVMPSSCRQSIVVVPPAHRRRAAELSPSGRRHIVVVPSSPSSCGPAVICHIALVHVFWTMLIYIYIYISLHLWWYIMIYIMIYTDV